MSLVDQFNEYNSDFEEITYNRNIIDSHIKKHKENNTLPDLNIVDKEAKKLINELRAEIEEVKKAIDNKMNGELEIQPMHDKKIIKKDENSSVSEREGFKKSKSFEKQLRTVNNKFKDKYYKIKSSKNYMKFLINKNIIKDKGKLQKLMMLSATILAVAIASGTMNILLLLAPVGFLIFRKLWRSMKHKLKLRKI